MTSVAHTIKTEATELAGPDGFALFVQRQNKVLSLILGNAPLDRVLAKAIETAQMLVPGVRCCVRVEAGGDGAPQVFGDDLPQRFREALLAIEGGGDDLPLTAAAVTGAPAAINDLAALAQPAGSAADLAALYHFRGHWAHPLLGDCGRAFGAFGCFSPEARTPTRQEERLLEGMAGLAAFAIEHSRKRAALDAANDRFAALCESIPGVVYQRVVEPDGQMRHTYVSRASEEVFGVTPEALVADENVFLSLHSPELAERLADDLRQASRDMTFWDSEKEITDRRGRRKFVHSIARPTRRADGAVVWDGVIVDQTRIKESELAAQAAEARARAAILESLSEAVALYDPDDRFVECNMQYVRLASGLGDCLRPGKSLRELVEADCLASIERGVDPEVAEREAAQRLAVKPGNSFVSMRQGASGRWYYVRQHRTLRGETVFTTTDITELKSREEALARSNEELESFASVASHDLQEPLRKIEAFGDRLIRRSGDQLSDDGRLCVDRMQNAAGRMRVLINDLLSYSRVSTKARPFDLCDMALIVGEVVGDLQIAIEEAGGEVDIGDLPKIAADSTQMRQLFQNIVGNALKYRKPDAAPKVAVRGALLGPDDARPPLLADAALIAKFTVSDNGIGFDMKYAEQIFAIFQRLHGRGEYSGTGIGLATVRKIVDRHRGHIAAESEPGLGSTFTILLPVAQDGVDPNRT